MAARRRTTVRSVDNGQVWCCAQGDYVAAQGCLGCEHFRDLLARGNGAVFVRCEPEERDCAQQTVVEFEEELRRYG